MLCSLFCWMFLFCSVCLDKTYAATALMPNQRQIYISTERRKLYSNHHVMNILFQIQEALPCLRGKFWTSTTLRILIRRRYLKWKGTEMLRSSSEWWHRATCAAPPAENTSTRYYHQTIGLYKIFDQREGNSMLAKRTLMTWITLGFEYTGKTANIIYVHCCLV